MLTDPNQVIEHDGATNRQILPGEVDPRLPEQTDAGPEAMPISETSTDIGVGQLTATNAEQLLLVPLHPDRLRVTITNMGTGTDNIAVGPNRGVSLLTGFLIRPGQTITLETRAALFVIGPTPAGVVVTWLSELRKA